MKSCLTVEHEVKLDRTGMSMVIYLVVWFSVKERNNKSPK